MPSGRGIQRTTEQKLADHAFIGDLLVCGYTSTNILEKLNGVRLYKLKLRTIQKDIADIRKAWGNSSRESFNFYVERELRLLNKVQLEAVEAWNKSKEEKMRQENEIAGSKSSKDRSQIRTKVIKETTPGSPEFLMIILKCLERQSKLLGLDKQHHLAPVLPVPLCNEKRVVEIKILGVSANH